ncbi:MAG: hypothetical protein WCG26_15030, partial [Chloroflexales bacterium]
LGWRSLPSQAIQAAQAAFVPRCCTVVRRGAEAPGAWLAKPAFAGYPGRAGGLRPTLLHRRSPGG